MSRTAVRDVYEAKRSSAAMAAFIAMAWRGEFSDEYFAQAALESHHLRLVHLLSLKPPGWAQAEYRR